MVTTVLENCPEQERYDYLDVLLYYYHEAHWDDEVGFILMVATFKFSKNSSDTAFCSSSSDIWSAADKLSAPKA